MLLSVESLRSRGQGCLKYTNMLRRKTTAWGWGQQSISWCKNGGMDFSPGFFPRQAGTLQLFFDEIINFYC